MESWTPEPLSLDLDNGVLFTYSPASISVISNTEAFDTGIDKRDDRCVVCGHPRDDAGTLQHCHIVPKIETKRWGFLKDHNLIPKQSKGVVHEARNGIAMCPNHHAQFDNHYFYIRWVPSSNMFVFINHSRVGSLGQYHGRAVRLYPNEPRVPFHGAFLDQEMRVRGLWPYLPYYKDRPVNLPIQWQAWINDAPGSTDRDGHKAVDETKGANFNTEHEDGDMEAHLAQTVVLDQSSKTQPTKGPRTKTPARIKKPKSATMTFTNPFSNPSELEAIMRSSREQPNWKAAEMEGESWEGTVEENVKKYQRIMNPPPVDWRLDWNQWRGLMFVATDLMDNVLVSDSASLLFLLFLRY